MPAGLLGKRCGLSGDEGACFAFLIRNPHRRGRELRLNIGGFLYTNQDSLSLGFVLPLDNLRCQFDGDHNLLLEWIKGLPQLASWIEGPGLARRPLAGELLSR